MILISHEAMPKTSNTSEAGKRAMAEYILGMGACLGDVLLSGFASIYFEKVRRYADVAARSTVAPLASCGYVAPLCAP